MNQHLELLETAEASLLAGCLNVQPFAIQACAQLAEQDFRNEGHQILFRAIDAVSRKGGHGVTDVTEWLIDEGKADEVTPADVSRLAGRNISKDIFAARLGKVRSAAHRRKIRQAALDVAAAAADWQTSDAELSQLAISSLLAAEQAAETGKVVNVKDRREELDRILSSGTSSRSVTTGWASLDKHYKPAPGRWTLVGGIPGHGKSSFLDALLYNLAERNNWRTMICSPEKQPLALHMAQLTQLKLGRPILDRGQPADGPDVSEAVDWVSEQFGWIELGDDGYDVASLLAIARLEHMQRPFDGLVIDPWNELDHSRDKALSETEHISQSLTRIRQFARKMDVHVWLVAHPTKMQKGVDGSYPVPRPYDVSGSAHWLNKADNALAVWRNHDRPEDGTQIHAQKVRFQPDDGEEGMTELYFDRSTGRFTERSPA